MTGADIRSWRERLGLTQAEAAKRLQVPLNTLKNWEQGQQRPDKWRAEGLRKKMVDYSGRRSAKVPEL